MGHSSSEVIDCAAEAVSDVDAVRLPIQPVEGVVVAAAVSAEGQSTNLGLRVVGVVDAHERCTDAARCVIHDLVEVKWNWELVTLWH